MSVDAQDRAAPGYRDRPRGRVRVPAAKLRIPLTAVAPVTRGRLLAMFEATGADVTLICGPAGAGKTTLLTDWVRRARPLGHRVAWVSLDADDNDVPRLWSAILAAVERTGLWRDGQGTHRLVPPGDRIGAGFLAAVTDALERLPAPVWLVLDDIHELSCPTALAGMDALLRRMPHRLRLVLAGRFPPPLGLARLRVEGRLREIGPGDLAFTRAEAAVLLGAHGVTLSDTDLDPLLARTEGWAAGLRLAVLSLIGSSDPSSVIADFVGDDRAMADYLVAEVLAGQPEHIRRFLLQTSVCEEFSVELAAALTGRDDAGHILAGLERENTLIVPSGPGRQRYRYHPLLRGYLRAELDRPRLTAARRLHTRAAHWYADRGATLPALEHAVAARDGCLVTRLTRRHGLAHVMSGDGGSLLHLLDRAPPDSHGDPVVALVAAAAALDANDPATADVWLARATGQPGDQDPPLRALAAAVDLHRARLGGDLAHALGAVLRTGDGTVGDLDVDLLTLVNRGTARLGLNQVDAADDDLRRALAMARAGHRDPVVLHCLIHLAVVSYLRSDLSEVARRSGEAIDFATRRGWAHTRRATLAYVLGAGAAYQRLDDDTARRYAALAVDLLEGRTEPSLALSARWLRAVLHLESATDLRDAAAELRSCWSPFTDARLSAPVVAYTGPVEQRIALRVGEEGWAAEVTDRVEARLGRQGEYHFMQAVLHAHRRRADAAGRRLTPVLAGEQPCASELTLIEAWLLEARLAGHGGDRRRAHHAVSEALVRAAPREARRPFLDGGQQIRDIMARGAGRFGRNESFAAGLLRAIPSAVRGPGQALTARERELLGELPSMRTVEEIAENVYVSVNTVKSHLRDIYRKLGVNSRRDAVAAARRFGLL